MFFLGEIFVYLFVQLKHLSLCGFARFQPCLIVLHPCHVVSKQRRLLEEIYDSHAPRISKIFGLHPPLVWQSVSRIPQRTTQKLDSLADMSTHTHTQKKEKKKE